MKTKRFSKSGPGRRKYAMITAYDALTARSLEAAGVDFILVGDSLGMVLLGYPTTSHVTMDEMIHHAKAVRRGAPKSFILGDLPRKGVEKGAVQALRSARRFRDEAGCDAVKIEWGKDCLRATELIVKAGIPVQGHVGLTPQDVRKPGDYRVKGRTAVEARVILEQAKAFEDAGASLLLMECVPTELAKLVTERSKAPVIGIGAGPYCDGQVLVFQDLVGLFDQFQPRFVKRFAETGVAVKKAVADYLRDVRAGRFPDSAHSFKMDPRELEALAVRSGEKR